VVEWRDRATLLKLAVAARVDSPTAHYGLGWGAINRGVNTPERYEVPAQQWAALDAGDGGSGLAVLAGAKYGWDRPHHGTLRMTWLHTPKVGRRFRFQGRQDLGRHEIDWALMPYRGGWGDAGVARSAERFERPLSASLVTSHPGGLGRCANLLAIDAPDFEASAVKLAQGGDRLILRAREATGSAARATVRLAEPIAAARCVDGREMPLESAGAISVEGSSLSFASARFATTSLEIDWAAPVRQRETWQPLSWRTEAIFCAEVGEEAPPGWAFPRHLWPAGPFDDGGIPFELAPAGGPLAMACRGQRIDLPDGCRRLAFLLAAVDGPRSFAPNWSEGAGRTVSVPAWRAVDGGPATLPAAWIANHLVRDGRLMPYCFAAIYRAEFDVPEGEAGCRLPDESRIVVFAVSAATANIAPCLD
jgi:hypothetical protein